MVSISIKTINHSRYKTTHHIEQTSNFKQVKLSEKVKMEGDKSDQKMLLDELSRARELMRQLTVHLSTNESYGTSARELMCSIEKAFSLAELSCFNDQEKRSTSGSLQSENEQDMREMSRKRKSLPTMTRQIQLAAEGEVSSMDDGYHWRKYGQKGILGAKHPRSYYRCTHRNTYGCSATKQMQKADNNPTVLNITYYGHHTCHQKIPTHEWQQDRFDSEHSHEQHHLLSFQTELKAQDQMSSSFSFLSAPFSQAQPGIRLFSTSTIDTRITESSSPTFVSQTSELKNYLNKGKNLQTSETELTEVISTATSTTNPLTVDMDFLLDPNFSFDDSNFLS
ncbi:WRKY domain-containing protein [Dioscorea alata]|uniref:WRKY domain-containing protein n=1 Tax=Dioscorea alata TaxID=55571 RepID=A0ACB7TVW1_DIOAL|nr:WRKY domain-containing protein [Dioscorea alata]